MTKHTHTTAPACCNAGKSQRNLKTIKNVIFWIKRSSRQLFTVMSFLFLVNLCAGQNIGINSTGAAPNASALLDVDAAPTNDKGLLIPRIALTQTTSNAPIGAGIEPSLMVFNTATINDVTPGYYYWDGTIWQRLLNNLPTPSDDWTILGNAGTIDGTNFIGTTDNVPFNFRVNNTKAGRIGTAADGSVFLGYQAGFNDDLSNNQNTFIGYSAGYFNTTGYNNTANGMNALYSNTTGYFNTANGSKALYSNTTGNNNTASGYGSLYSNTTGYFNTASGYQALYSNTTGGNNIANGFQALYSNTTGSNNIANGVSALWSNTTGSFNTASGSDALYSNTTGLENTANGHYALSSNTTGNANTANGVGALAFNTIGSGNIANGDGALWSNTTGNFNTANGNEALNTNTTGNFNTANGVSALSANTIGNDNTANGSLALYLNVGDNNTANGSYALYSSTTGLDNTALGYYAGRGALGANFNQCTFLGSTSYPTVNRTNVTMLGYGIADAQCTADNQVLLGNTAIAQIRAQVTGITAYSDARFKKNIKEDVKGLDFIMKLNPVTYNEDPTILHKIWGTPDSLVSKIDHSQIQQQRFIGFLAQDVEKAAKEIGFDFPGIDIPKNEKEVYSLRYSDFIMPMVKAMQEQQKMIEKQQKLIEKLMEKMNLQKEE